MRLLDGAMDSRRTCIGCRNVARKGDMLRIVRDKEASVSLDASSKLPGRGAYVCSSACFYKVLDNGRLSSALKTRISSDLRSKLVCEYKAYAGVTDNEE